MQKYIAPVILFGLGALLVACCAQVDATCLVESTLLQITTKCTLVIGVSLMVLTVGYVMCGRSCGWAGGAGDVMSGRVLYSIVCALGLLIVGLGGLMLSQYKCGNKTANTLLWIIVGVGIATLAAGVYMMTFGIRAAAVE